MRYFAEMIERWWLSLTDCVKIKKFKGEIFRILARLMYLQTDYVFSYAVRTALRQSILSRVGETALGDVEARPHKNPFGTDEYGISTTKNDAICLWVYVDRPAACH